MARHRLSPEIVLDGCVELIDRAGEQFTLVQLGEQLGVDPTAVYRHFRTKDDLMRAVADRILSVVAPGERPSKLDEDWRTLVIDVCTRLRQVHVQHPAIAALARQGPPLGTNEFDLTEALLGALQQGGLPPRDAARAYHALIELTIGSAVLDSTVAAMPSRERDNEYDRWRRAYHGLDPGVHPTAVAHADHLYVDTADERFRCSLAWLLAGIESSVAGVSPAVS